MTTSSTPRAVAHGRTQRQPPPARHTRRALGLAGLVALAGHTFGPLATPAPAAADTAAAPMAAAAAVGDLRPLPAHEAPFDAAGRRELAMDALTFLVWQHGLFPGRGVYQLPAAPWLTGELDAVPRRAWDMAVPAGVPLYLLAHADPAGDLDPAQTAVTVNGAALPGLAAYVHGGVPALHEGRMQTYAVLDLVFAPAAPGRYTVEVRTQAPAAPPPLVEGGPIPLARPAATTNSWVLAYDVTVLPADALGPRLFRDPAGSVFATHGSERRRVPDAETLRLLGYPPDSIWPAAPALLAAIPEGPPLPELREGMLVRADNHPAVFRLEGGRRVWLNAYERPAAAPAPPAPPASTEADPVNGGDDAPGAEAAPESSPIAGTADGEGRADAAQGPEAAPESSLIFGPPGPPRTAGSVATLVGAAEIRVVEAAVLQTIPPALQSDMLLKGAAADVYHVDGANGTTLRKIPDWTWAREHHLPPDDVLYVPDRLIAGLPQNSPHWVMPGGFWMDRAFYSPALGRSMPYRVYLPPAYDAPDQAGQRYPVLYLLHGLSARYDEWSGYGVEEVANELLRDGTFVKAIIVAPQGGLGYWMNQEGGTAWGDYVARDLVAHVDATYRTLPRREARGIGGLSMGAHGALQLALNHPAVFGVAGVHSPSIRTRVAGNAPPFFGDDAGFARRDPITLVRTTPLATPPLIWLDTGDRDHWRAGAWELHFALLDRGWNHEWHVFPGEHDGWFWGDHLWDYLGFYARAFASGGVPLAR